MPATPEQVHDLAVLHRIDLSRYSTDVVRKVMALMNRMGEDVAARLMRADNQTITARRLTALLASVRDIHASAFAEIGKRLNASVAELASEETHFAERLVQVSANVGATFSPAPAPVQVIAAVKARPFQGKYLKDWLAEAEEGAARRTRDVIRQGFVEGRTTQEIIRLIRGTAAARFKDGILEISRRGAEAMVRTALTHTSNVAHQTTFQEMGVLEWRFVATLDRRTTLICASLHGKLFPVGKGPQPPRHINCRSTSIPMVDPIPGVAPFEFPSYEAWLKKQPAAVQRQILGAKRFALFRTGGLKLDQFVDGAGKSLTLDQLKAKNAKAFEKGGPRPADQAAPRPGA